MTPEDHPGGPLSRAERVLLAHLKNRYFEARTMLVNTRQLIGAIPGAQKIDANLHDAITAVDRLLESIKTRKQGAPMSDFIEDAAEPPKEASKELK